MRAALRTPLCDTLEIEAPIVQGADRLGVHA